MNSPGNFLFFSFFLLFFSACSANLNSATQNTLEPVPGDDTILTATVGTAEIPRPTPTSAAPGTIENPLIVALPPGSGSDADRVEAGKAFAEQLSEVTGYAFVVVAPDTQLKLVQALGAGNAHVAVLSAYAYVLAYNEGYANAAFARLDAGEKAYGTQFIARTDAGLQSYYNAYMGENTTDAATALAQFRDKKPCWPDEVSLSGYVIPAGMLAYNEIPLRAAAILQGQPTVVRAVYVGGICDFGATYVDARIFPAILDEYPDVIDEVSVIWRTPPIIPYEVLVIARNLPPEIVLAISDALFRITGMQAGRQVLGQAYEIQEWERIDDTFYEEFRLYVNASRVDLEAILEELP